jgi:hypothetical protein
VMADDTVLAFDRDAILQRMVAERIDATGDAHARVLTRPEPLPPRARPRTATGDGKRDIATIDGVGATTEHMRCSFPGRYRVRRERSKRRSRPLRGNDSGTYETGT